jgi:uncharacterized protein (TIGR00369 family)
VNRALELAREAQASGDYSALVAWIPYAVWLGIDVEMVEGELRSKLTFNERNVGNASLPALHGGTMGALLESAAIFELLYRARSTALPKTITITIDYLRPARTVTTYAVAKVVRQGRRVTTVRCEAWQEDRDRPVTLATAHFLVLAD